MIIKDLLFAVRTFVLLFCRRTVKALIQYVTTPAIDDKRIQCTHAVAMFYDGRTYNRLVSGYIYIAHIYFHRQKEFAVVFVSLLLLYHQCIFLNRILCRHRYATSAYD